jgi:heat shock protein HslJ
MTMKRIGSTLFHPLLPVAVLLTGATLAGCGESGSRAADSQPVPETLASQQNGAATAPAPEQETPLGGTEWRLVEMQSMDDAVGTTRPEDSTLYTMSLAADGRASLRLDCNRATGTWTVEPSADPANGRFEFGPLATTRAQCPPSSLYERLAVQLPYVRGYLVKDGRLYLSLMADGGILAWEPLSDISFQTEPDEEIEAAILRASPDYTRQIVGADGESAPARYVYGRVDLNGDGQDEVLVYLLGSIFCGTGGCNLLLLESAGDGYALINEFPISRVPVIVSPGRTGGWNDLFRPESGGGAPPSFVRHAFDGARYVERERLPAEPAPAGTRILAGDLAFEVGVPLEPGD